MPNMDEKILVEIDRLSGELADVVTVIFLLMESKSDNHKLDIYISEKQDLEGKIRDLTER